VPSFANPPRQLSPSGQPETAVRVWDIVVPLRIWHLASLDAPTVAVVWACAFAWVVHVRLPAWAPALLALGAWAVYIGDRLLDARAGMCTPPKHQLRDRHHFHWRHRSVLTPLAVLAATASLWIVVTRIPAAARVPDSAIAAATLAYFSSVHSRRRLPECLARLLHPLLSRAVLIGVLFTAGCLLPVWSQAALRVPPRPVERLLLIPALFFAALGWLNCHAIAQWESNRGVHSKPVRPIACFVGLVGFCLAVLLVWNEPRSAALIAAGAASSLLLALLDRFRARLTPLAVRAGADLVLLTPALLLIQAPFRP
jgi:hypothetical protein